MTKVQAELDETKIILVSGGGGEHPLEPSVGAAWRAVQAWVWGFGGVLMQMLCWKGWLPASPRVSQATLSLCCLHPSGFNTTVV